MGLRAVLRVALFMVLAHCSVSWARVFFTGSNPMLSMAAFPQDIFLVPGEQVFWYGYYQQFPWWGDIDEPDNRPNKEYILTGEKTADWQHDEGIDQFFNEVGFSRIFSDSLKARFDLEYTSAHLGADAEGTTGADYGNHKGIYSNVPYTYRERNGTREMYLSSMWATKYKTIPIGFNIGIGGQFASKPDVEFLQYQGNQIYPSPMLMWGWNGDGYQYEDEYNVGSLFKFDAQSAATFPRYKIGTRFRMYLGTLDHYHWDTTGDYTSYPNKIRNLTGRLYGIYNWYQREKFKFNTTVLTRYTFIDSTEHYPDHDGNAVKKAKQFVFQINPNVNIYPWKYPMSYIDAAILCNYSHTSYDHVWVGSDGAESYAWSGSASGEDYSGEQYSYGRENFFELAIDLNSAIPVFGMKDQRVALGVTMFLWRRYKWFNKYFGNPGSGGFTLNNIRKNLDMETWLNSVLNIFYQRGEYNFRLDIGQPLIYSLTPRTIITDPSGKNIQYEKTKENMWLSQSGLKLGLYVSTSLENFLSFRIFHPSEKP